MEFIFISVISLCAAFLTFFSGFGLGTILFPVYAMFFPIPIAIAQTALVHLLNNLTKGIIVGRHADKKVVIQFGIPAMIGAAMGATIFMTVDHLSPWYSYHLFEKTFYITPLKVLVGIVILLFTLGETFLANWMYCVTRKTLWIGGILSGFFGGLSGHQGALRTSFLIHIAQTKEIFLGTGIILAILVDITRLPLYTYYLFSINDGVQNNDHSYTLLLAVIFAFIGTLMAARLFQKVTLPLLHRSISIALILFALMLIVGCV